MTTLKLDSTHKNPEDFNFSLSFCKHKKNISYAENQLLDRRHKKPVPKIIKSARIHGRSEKPGIYLSGLSINQLIMKTKSLRSINRSLSRKTAIRIPQIHENNISKNSRIDLSTKIKENLCRV